MRDLQQQVSSILGAKTSVPTSLPESSTANLSYQVLNLTPDPAPIFPAPGLTPAMQAGLGMQHSGLTMEYLHNNHTIASQANDTQEVSTLDHGMGTQLGNRYSQVTNSYIHEFAPGFSYISQLNQNNTLKLLCRFVFQS